MMKLRPHWLIIFTHIIIDVFGTARRNDESTIVVAKM